MYTQEMGRRLRDKGDDGEDAGGEPPTYGRIVLRRAATVAAVLAGRPLVKLVVNGRHLWARKYVPRLSVAAT